MGKVVIDTDKWTTQAKLAKKLKTSRQNISNRVKRNQIATKEIAELNLVLVDKNATVIQK